MLDFLTFWSPLVRFIRWAWPYVCSWAEHFSLVINDAWTEFLSTYGSLSGLFLFLVPLSLLAGVFSIVHRVICNSFY